MEGEGRIGLLIRGFDFYIGPCTYCLSKKLLSGHELKPPQLSHELDAEGLWTKDNLHTFEMGTIQY